MHITINGESREIPDGLSISALIRHLEMPPERLAVERNREVVSRSKWETTMLEENDRVEVIHFVGGGGSDVMSYTEAINEPRCVSGSNW